MRKLKISCNPAGEGGVAFYRIVQPYTYLQKYFDIFIFDNKKHHPEMLRMQQEIADVLVYQMPWGENIERIIDYNRSRPNPKKIVLEYDDNVFHINPFNEAYKIFGQDNVQNTILDKETINNFIKLGFKRAKANKETRAHLKTAGIKEEDVFVMDLWKNGSKDFDLERNRTAKDFTIKALAKADLITTTTKHLAEQLSKFTNTRIEVLPNLIDPDRWRPMMPNETDEIRIGWQGGSAHFLDMYMVANVFDELFKKYPKLKFVTKGGLYPSLFEKWKDRLEFQNWHGDIKTYPLDVRSMKCDIMIAPLIDDPFNRSKSELKFLEYAILGVPGVYSHTCYENVVKHGKTGMLARNHAEWVQYLSKLIDDKQLRKEIADKAKTRVLNYHAINQADRYRDILLEITQKVAVAA